MQTEKMRETAIQFLRFGLIGGLGFIVDVGFFHIALDILELGHYGSAVFSFPFAATFTWLGNRVFTFKDRNAGHAGAQWARFLAVCAVGFVLNRGTYSLMVMNLPLAHSYPVLALFGGTMAGMVFNFVFSKRLVFR
ncbi:MAG: GtrA family protein [Bdellovibrionales bacterium]